MAAPRPIETSFPQDSHPVPMVLLERFRRGELPPPAMRKLEMRYDHDPKMRAEIAALAASDLEILASLPPETFMRQLHQRDQRSKIGSRVQSPEPRWAQPASIRPALGFALAVLLILPASVFYLRQTALVMPPTESTSAQAPSPTERIKGLEPKIALFRKAQRGAEPLRPGDAVGPGAILRIGYHAAGHRFGAILSCDGNGQVTIHFPAQGGQAATLETGESLLPTAYELDAAPEYERFFLVTSDTSFALEPLRQVLARDRDLHRLPPTYPILRATRFDLRKESLL